VFFKIGSGDGELEHIQFAGDLPAISVFFIIRLDEFSRPQDL